MNAGYGVVFPQHAALLRASGITPEVATARGYKSADTKTTLARYGFNAAQCLVPGLLIPVYGVDGGLRFYQFRPDAPRFNGEGKPIKYETPPNVRMALDVHPMVRHRLGDPKQPLFITEGARKSDAAISHGLCCVALLGVWNWRGRNADGGKVALPDWESVALEGRQVYLVFDSDVSVKPEVFKALERLKSFLESRKARVSVIYLPAGPNGEKVGLDDYLAAGHSTDELLALATDTLRAAPADASQTVDPTMQRLAGDFTFACPDGLVITVAALHEVADGLSGELHVRADERLLHWGRLTLASTSQRRELVRKLQGVWPDLDWGRTMETVCFRVAEESRRGEPVVVLQPVEHPQRELVAKVLPEGDATVLFAPPGAGKGWIALLLAFALTTEKPLPGGLRPRQRTSTLYLDWEWAFQASHRGWPKQRRYHPMPTTPTIAPTTGVAPLSAKPATKNIATEDKIRRLGPANRVGCWAGPTGLDRACEEEDELNGVSGASFFRRRCSRCGISPSQEFPSMCRLP